MRHEDIIAKLSEYRDAELGAAERREVAAHVERCAGCAALLADWESLAAAFLRRPGAPTPVATEAFVARVMSRLPQETEPLSRLFGRWLAPALGVSFAVLALSFRPYPRSEASDPAGALLTADSERGVSTIAPEASSADLLGLGAEDR